MMEKVKLNKVSLRTQKQQLAMYQQFLPSLEARKQQFLVQMGIVRKEIAKQEQLLKDLLADIARWAPLYRDIGNLLKYHLKIKEIKIYDKNIAGIMVPVFHGIIFNDPPYSYFAIPPSFENAVHKSREAIYCREALHILKGQEMMLFEGFRKASQRINLYEQKLIPDCHEAIRRIVVHLQDQRAAAVGVAKTAKRMTEAIMLQDEHAS